MRPIRSLIPIITAWTAVAAHAAELTAQRVHRVAVGDTLEAAVYLPPGYDPARRYPVVYALVTEPYFSFEQVRTDAWLDSAIVAGLPPLIVVGVPNPGTAEEMRPDTPEGDAYRRFIVNELLPAVERSFPVAAERRARALIGFSAGANVAVDLAVRHPEMFSRVAAQSPGWMFGGRDGRISAEFAREALQAMRASPGVRDVAFWFVWGDADDAWESRSRLHGEAAMRALRAAGAAVETGTPIPGGHGLHQIRASLAEAMAFLTDGG